MCFVSRSTFSLAAFGMLMFDASCLSAQSTSSFKPIMDQIDRLDDQLRQDPADVNALQRRGMARFKIGDCDGSISDFDRAIKLMPELAPRHWQRGLSCYYAGRFKEGARQFELYQTYDSDDVENICWRFLCQAKYEGIEVAREEMLPLNGVDKRVPMMSIDALYRGTAEVDDVFRAAQAGTPTDEQQRYRRFYANLYVGLYHDAIGEPEAARKKIFAASELKNDHYMWYVAHLHASRLRDEE